MKLRNPRSLHLRFTTQDWLRSLKAERIAALATGDYRPPKSLLSPASDLESFKSLHVLDGLKLGAQGGRHT